MLQETSSSDATPSRLPAGTVRAGRDGTAQQPSEAKPAYWGEAFAPYARPDPRHSAGGLATSVVPFLALSALMYLALDVSYGLTLRSRSPPPAFWFAPTSSFTTARTARSWPPSVPTRGSARSSGCSCSPTSAPGNTTTPSITPTAGDLDRRGTGDVPTITVAEYQARGRRGRLAYRLFRHPLVMFGLGPIFALPSRRGSSRAPPGRGSGTA